MKKQTPKTLIFLALVLASGCKQKAPLGGSLNIMSTTDTTGIAIYVMIGHSNMLARGAEPSSYRPTPNILMYGTTSWAIASEPTGLVMDPVAGVSPGLSFAYAIQSLTPGKRIGLINCAQGGSTSYQFGPGYSLYDQCAERIALASADGYIAGVIAWTGENDGDVADWTETFTNLVRSYRALAHNPKMPVAFARVSPTFPGPAAGVANLRAQENAFHMSGVSMVDSDNLPTEDGVHLNTDSQEIMGRRYANAIIGAGNL